MVPSPVGEEGPVTVVVTGSVTVKLGPSALPNISTDPDPPNGSENISVIESTAVAKSSGVVACNAEMAAVVTVRIGDTNHLPSTLWVITPTSAVLVLDNAWVGRSRIPPPNIPNPPSGASHELKLGPMSGLSVSTVVQPSWTP